jgi:hypothetical protein
MRKLAAFLAAVCLLTASCGDDDARPSRDRGRDDDRPRRDGRADDARPEDAPPPAPADPLVGRWRSPDGAIDAEFTDDGQCRYTVREDGGVDRGRGPYTFRDNVLEIRPEGEQPMRYRANMPDTDTLALEGDGERIRLVRQPPGDDGADPDRGPDPDGPAVPPPANDPFPGLARQRHEDILPPVERLRPVAGGHILYTRYEVLPDVTGTGGPSTPLGKVYVMTGEGEGQFPLIRPPHPWQAGTPNFSPDGRRILFSSDFRMWRSALFTDIFMTDLGTGWTWRVTGAEGFPGGARPERGTVECAIIDDHGGLVDRKKQVHVAIQGHDDMLDLPGELQFDINNAPAGKIWIKCWVSKHVGDLKIVDVPAGGTVRADEMKLSSGNFLATHPSLTPDGRYLVFLSQHAYYDRRQKIREQGYDTVAVMDLHNPAKLAITWDPMTVGGELSKAPELSPDGRWIAVSMGLPPKESLAICPLESVLAGQPRPQVIVPGQMFVGGGTGHTDPAWSPDGRRIAFARYTTTTEWMKGDIFVVNADGSGLRQVTQVAGNQMAVGPSWSPDGRRIAFQLVTSRRPVLFVTDIAVRNVTSDIWTIAADGSDPRQLTADGRSAEPAWGP